MPSRTNEYSAHLSGEPKFWCSLVDEEIMKMLLSAEAAIQQDILCSNDRSAKHTSQLYLLDLLLYVTHKRPLYPAAVTWLKGFVSFLISLNGNVRDHVYPFPMPSDAPILADRRPPPPRVFSSTAAAPQQNVAWPTLSLPPTTGTVTMVRADGGTPEQAEPPSFLSVPHHVQRMSADSEDEDTMDENPPSPQDEEGAAYMPPQHEEANFVLPTNVWGAPTRDDVRYFQNWNNFLKDGVPLDNEALAWMIIAIVKIHRNLMAHPSLQVFTSVHSSDRASDVDH